MNFGPDQSEQWIKTTCAYCGVGCGIEAKVEDAPPGSEAIVSVRGDQSHPANFGRLCSKGLALGETVKAQGRLETPLIMGEPTDWDSALTHVADKFQQTIEQYGKDSVAFYVSGQLLTEDYYVANKLMKGFIGSGNIDTNSRVCMSSSVAGHKRAFGTDTVPNAYVDIEQADLVVLTGSNLAWCHPVLFQRLKAAKAQRPQMKVVVIDPRHTDTCTIADLHLPIKSGADVLLFNGLLAYLENRGCLDKEYLAAHTEGFEQALASAQDDIKDQQAFYARLGIAQSLVTTFYHWVAETPKTLTMYSQGVNQSSAGVDKVNAIINTHLATGRIGKPGAGPFSVTGQPNAMGGREVGGLANMLASHIEFGNEQGHQLVSEFWQTDRLATDQGLKALDLYDAVADGKIKALWIMATNPAASLPNANKIKTAIANCDFVVVSDCIADTDTTRLGHVLLPAQGWAEKSGTVTNSERRISRQKQLIPSVGVAKPDWWIIAEVAKRMGFVEPFSYNSEADVFREYAQSTGLGQASGLERDLDISALATLTDSEYLDLAPLQWPFSPGDDGKTTKRFFADGGFYTPNRKGKFIAVNYRPPQTATTGHYPLVLNTGRIRDQWHTMTRTGLAPRLGAHRPQPYVSVNPADACAFGVADGDIGEVTSSYSRALARVRVTEEVPAGQVFMAIHWTDNNSSHGKVSSVVSPERDPISGQPESKFTPVKLANWRYRSEAQLLSRVEIDLKECGYWARQNIDQGYLYFIASPMSPAELGAYLSTKLADELQVDQLTFNDSGRGTYRSARFRVGRLVDAIMVADKLKNDELGWLAELLATKADIEVKRSLLGGAACGELAQGRQICACKKVGLKTIQAAITEQQLTSVQAICDATQAGTGCGSCLPELQELLGSH